MKISEVQIVPIKPKNGLVGFASLVLEDSFYLGCIGIFTRPQGGYRLTYPTRLNQGGSQSIFYPINKSRSEEIEKVIITKFEEVMNKYVRHDQTSVR